MVELLEPITRSRLDLHDNGSVIIPAILPPRIALGLREFLWWETVTVDKAA